MRMIRIIVFTIIGFVALPIIGFGIYFQFLFPTNFQELINLSCGGFSLVISERTEKTFETTFHSLELNYKKYGSRLIDRIGDQTFVHSVPRNLPDIILDPNLDFKKPKFFDSTDDDSWNIYVDPANFTKTEYKNISRCIGENNDDINSVILKSKYYQYESIFMDNASQVKGINSILYANADTLTLKFTCSDGYIVNVAASGRVDRIIQTQNSVSEGLMGGIVDNGKNFLLISFPNETQKRYPEYLKGCRDGKGKSFFEYYKLRSS